MVLGKLPVPGRPTIWISVGQGPTALAAGAGGGCLDIFTLIYPFFPLSPSLWETARYRLKYCLKGPLNPKPTNNQPIFMNNIGPDIDDPVTRWKLNKAYWTQFQTLCTTGLLEDTVRKAGDPIESFASILIGGGRVVRGCWVNFQRRGVLLIWIIVEQGPTALALGAGGRCLDIFSLVLPLSGRRPDID